MASATADDPVTSGEALPVVQDSDDDDDDASTDASEEVANFKYPRNFLLQFQNIFTEKPEDLPNIEIIKGFIAQPGSESSGGKGGGKRSGGKGGRDRGSGSGFRGDAPQRNRRDGGRDNRRGGKGRKPGEMPLSTGPVKALEMSENRWKGKKETEPADEADEAAQREVFSGKIRSILNKLTPEKFEKLFDQFLEVGIDGVEKLRWAIDEIFDKALGEIVFGSMYAVLCQCLSEKLPEFEEEDEDGKMAKMSFRRILLNKCQEEFEKEDQIAAIEDEIDRAKAKRRMLGNIHFIGELYLKRMLKENIMYFCVAKLTGDPANPDEEDIEALCKLLSTIGATLEKASSQVQGGAENHLDKCFRQLKQIKDAKPPLLEARFRFMIADLFDLRAAKWKSRNQTIGPTTIANFHKQTSKAESQAQQNQRRRSVDNGRDFNRRDDRRMQGGGDRRMPKNSAPVTMGAGRKSRDEERRGGGSGGDGWAVAGKKSGGEEGGWEQAASRGGGNRGRGSRDNGPRSPKDERKGGSQDARGSFGKGRQQAAPEKAKPKEKASFGAFGGLAVDDDEDDEDDEDEEEAVVDSEASKDESDAAKSPVDAGSGLSKAEVEKKVESILEEFIASNDEGEAALCVKELACEEHHSAMIGMMICYVMEKKEDARTKVDKLLSHLVTQKVVSPEHVAAGLKELMATVDDISMDVPKFGNYVAKSTGILAACGGVAPSSFPSLLEPLAGAPLHAKMVAWVVDAIGDEAKAKEWYSASGVNLVECMLEGDQTPEAAKEMLERSSMKCSHLVWMVE